MQNPSIHLSETAPRRFRWLIPAVIAALTFVALIFATQVNVYAAPQHGFGQGQGRTGPVLENDYHTAAWERFHFNYHFESGMDYRFDLGWPTTWDGFVPVDVYSVNFTAHHSLSTTCAVGSAWMQHCN